MVNQELYFKFTFVYFEILKHFPLYVKPTKIVLFIIVFWLALGNYFNFH